MKRVFVSDCEGPISKNDNAFELTAHFVPQGDKLFTLISRYDDVLADVVKKPGYNAGDTLKLILPFLKAFDVTDNQMEQFSCENLLLIAGTKETLNRLKEMTEIFIVSTSYEHYIRALCKTLDFPFENTYCTMLSIDKYNLPAGEKSKLREIAKEVASMPMITIPPSAHALKDLSPKDQKTVIRLNKIFWEEIASMKIGRIVSGTRTIGGEQKSQAIQEIAKRLKLSLADVMYVGDSITDVQAFQLVRESGGLTVSFNGNNYAVETAEVAVMSENNIVTAVLADAFIRGGRWAVSQLIDSWTPEGLRQKVTDLALSSRIFTLFPKALPKVQIVTKANMESLSKESSEFRKKVRGEAVGKLG